MEWILETWNAYKDVILPIINTLLVTFLLPMITFWVKKKMQEAAIKAEMQLKALQNVANREDVKPEIGDLNSKLVDLEGKISFLGEMFQTVFQNSVGLDDEVKNKITVIANKMNHNTTDTMLIEVTKELDRVNEQLETLKNKTQIVNVAPIASSTPSKKKKNRLGR